MGAEKVWSIYLVEHIPSGSVYIGCTSQKLYDRKQDYYKKKVGHVGFKNFLHKHKREEFSWTILMTSASRKEGLRKEAAVIRHYRLAGFPLLNPETKVPMNKHKVWSIYSVEHIPSGSVYIGCTSTKVQSRIRVHYCFSKRRTSKFYMFLGKYPRYEFEWTVLMRASTKEEGLLKEAAVIRHYRLAGFELLNRSSYGNASYKHTDIERLKLSIAKSGYHFNVYKDGKFVGKWQNQRICAIDLGIKYPASINVCLRGMRKSYKGYTFIRCEGSPPTLPAS